ncbi:MAG: hypothetical protein NZ749_09405 [bacterium]|nr:hypothetical protein [bacterium]
MKAFLRLWAMFVWLMVTNPASWALAAAVLYGVRRWRLPEWTWFWGFASAAVLSLLISLFVEAGGALGERVRFAGSGRIALGAATAAAATCALGFWVASSVLWVR